MNMWNGVKHLLLGLVLSGFASVSLAQWELDSAKSGVNFISIKNNAVGEAHSFASLVGFIGEGGNVKVIIDLDSVQTHIDIRNERMREMLFESARFPAAQITAQLEPAVLDGLAEGATVSLDMPLELSLHGVTKTLSAPLVAVGEGGRIRVFSSSPILLSAADFGLEAGVNALREVAGLEAISNAIPVTVHLVFVPVHR